MTEFGKSSCVIQDLTPFALATACALKTQFPKAQLVGTSDTKEAYYKLTLENVILTSISTSVSAGEAHPHESFTLSFRKGTWEYGTAKGGYDLDKHKWV